MGLLGDIFDDVFELPGKIIGGLGGMTADIIAKTLTLPVSLVEAAIEAGCKTEEEIREFCERRM
jgi:hypothetical protein